MSRIEIIGKLPQKLILACSGGVDSMAVLSFLMGARRDITVAHFQHGFSDYQKEAKNFVEEFCHSNNLKFISESVLNELEEPSESDYRNARYAWLDSLGDTPIITCHHLGDALEWWLFTSIRGSGKVMPPKRGKYLKPFLKTKKEVFYSWCKEKNVPFVEDPSNEVNKYSRNRIRNKVIPELEIVHPGIWTTMRKRY